LNRAKGRNFFMCRVFEPEKSVNFS
jgi:hypothetical protein